MCTGKTRYFALLFWLPWKLFQKLPMAPNLVFPCVAVPLRLCVFLIDLCFGCLSGFVCNCC